MLIQKHIEIIRSTTPGLSSLSMGSALAMLVLLSHHYSDVHITTVNSAADLESLVSKQPDLVFVGVKFVPVNHALGFQDPDKVWVSAFLDDYRVAYTGSDHFAHKLELDKHLAKARALEFGIKTAAYQHVKRNDLPLTASLPLTFPVFIKPTDRGGGLGIDSRSIAYNFDDLRAKVQSIAERNKSDSLVEEYLPGREFSVAILKDEFLDNFSVMPLELVAPEDQYGARFLSSQVKMADSEQFMAVTDESLRTELCALALSTFHALGARDYGRIDIRLDESGVPHFLEANLIPSLINGYGNFPKACALNLGMDYETMLLRIVKLGLSRSAGSLIQEATREPDPLFSPLIIAEPAV